jgi:transcriptional regulator
VVVEVHVSQGDAFDALGDQLFQEVIDEAGIAMIHEAAGDAAGQTQALIDLAQQQGAAV